MSLCQACKADLPSYDPDRGTGQRGGNSIMDRICNSLVNPRNFRRFGRYEDRLKALQDLHTWLRDDRPGWGAYRPRQVRRLLQSELGAANRAGLAAALVEAELFRRPA